MTLHFAYGSNMSRELMRSHAPQAKPLGVATLQGFRFLIMADGYASVERTAAETVHGVLWRITPRDWDFFKTYDRFYRISEDTLRETSTAGAPELYERLYEASTGTTKVTRARCSA